MNWSNDCLTLKQWFIAEKRDLPWRHTTDPYAIWISEVMLQQTQVAVVLSYYKNWMQRFPTIQYLAQASREEVIKAWEGLGYYSRARNLHEGAQYILDHFGGQLPSNEEQLSCIKGLGPYTIGAILSFAFHQRKAAVDGNVLRVLTRYLGLEDDIAKSATQRKLRVIAEQLLPEEEPWIINEALIELGATICQRKARCLICPLRAGCESARHGLTDRLPVKSKGASIEFLYRAVAVIRQGDFYLVKKGKKGEIMSDLYEFPYFTISKEGILLEEFQVIVQQTYSAKVQFHKKLQEVEHGFTRYHVRLTPFLFHLAETFLLDDLEWLSLDQLKERPFSSGHRRLFQQVEALHSADD
jgi:A/G-specific adenine glycosylase